MKFSLLVLILFSTLTLAQENISIMAPLEGDHIVEGEINFQWNRPSGDRSPVRIIVEEATTGREVLTRRTTGTRRTRWLAPGSYRWRLHGNKLLGSTQWTHFFIDSKGGTPTPEKRADIKIIDPPKEKQKDTDVQAPTTPINTTVKQLAPLPSPRKPSKEEKVEVVEKVEERAPIVEIKIEKPAKKVTKPKDYTAELGERPKQKMGGQVKLVKEYILQRSKYPRTIEFEEWHQVAPRRYKGQVYWATRVKFYGRNAFGDKKFEDAVAFIRFGNVEHLKSACDVGFDCF